MPFNIAPDGSAPFVGTNFSSRNASWIDPNIRPPYIMNWSGGFQWELLSNLLVETIYQGSAGVGLLNNWDINAIPLNISSDYATLDNIRRNYQNFKPYPQFGQIQLYSNFGHNTYHSAHRPRGAPLSQRPLRQRFLHLVEEPDRRRRRRRRQRRHLLQPPAGKGALEFRHLAPVRGDVHLRACPTARAAIAATTAESTNFVLGGWDLMFSQTLQSGPPITVTFAGAPSTPYAPGQPYVWLPMQQRPNQILPNDQASRQGWTIGPNRLPTSAQNPYLNAAAFAYPAPFTPGTLGRNTLTSPGLVWAQTSLSKTWKICASGCSFQIRWDLNNPYKRINFSRSESRVQRGDAEHIRPLHRHARQLQRRRRPH